MNTVHLRGKNTEDWILALNIYKNDHKIMEI
jgi:hypothetical protein